MNKKKKEHFKQRQIKRKVDDYTIQKTLIFGTKSVVNGCINHVWGTIRVVEAPDGELVTVHPGDHPIEAAKLLPGNLGNVLRLKINVSEAQRRETAVPESLEKEAEVISLEDYLSGKWLKKAS